jgi:hypothetical protein
MLRFLGLFIRHLESRALLCQIGSKKFPLNFLSFIRACIYADMFDIEVSVYLFLAQRGGGLFRRSKIMQNLSMYTHLLSLYLS